MLVQGVQYAGLTTASIVAITTFEVTLGKIVSFLTEGQFTLLKAAILSSPYIFPIIVKLAIDGLATTMILSVLTGISVVTKCSSAALLGRDITWENWKFVI